MHLHILGVSACDWGCGSLLLFGHPHVFRCLPCVQHPDALYAYLYVLGVICMCYGGNIPYVGGLGHIYQVFGVCHYIHWMSIMLHLILVVHYVSSFYFHSYNYYSSSDCGVFWYLISIIGDHGSYSDGVSHNVGSA